jgi:predicted RNase H-like HicB family nuclease
MYAYDFKVLLLRRELSGSCRLLQSRRTVAEALANIKEAIELCLEDNTAESILIR